MRKCGEINMSALRINEDIKNTIKHWKYIASDIHQPLNDRDYDNLSKILDKLLDIVGEDENHELIGLVDFVSHMIATYDDRKKYQIKNVSGVDALKFLMQQHHLKQSDLPEVGSQGVVSEILQGRRKLNINQIKKLAKRFHVSAETFID